MRATRNKRWLKTVDRYVGIPLVAALAPLRIGRKRPTEFRRIGVMKTAAIGDLVLASGPIADLRHAYPNAELILITGTDNAAVVPLFPFAVESQVIVSPTQPADAVRRIRELRLDLIVDLGSWPRFDALIAGLSGALWRVGFRRGGQGRHWAFDQTVAHSSELHELDNYRALIRSLGVSTKRFPSLRVVDGSRADARRRPYIVFHPWSGGDRGWIKEWPADRWIELSTRLGNQFDCVVTAGPADRERSSALVSGMLEAGVTARVASLSLEATAWLLAESAGVISVNTGIMHVAAAVGARTLSLEGPVPVRRWGPIGQRVASVGSVLPDCGFLDLGFEYDGQRNDCMDSVGVETVQEAFRALLGSSTPII